MAYVYDWKKSTNITVQLMCGHLYTVSMETAEDLSYHAVHCGKCDAQSKFPYIELVEAPLPRISLGDRVLITDEHSSHYGCEADVVREPTPRNGTYLVSLPSGAMRSYYGNCLERVKV